VIKGDESFGTVTGRTLVIAWGNPARRDDGLGPALARAVEMSTDGLVDIEIDYQLQIEHARDVARYRRVVFVDAACSGAAPFSLRRVSATSPGTGFSSHSVSPGSILALSRDLFASEPEAWLLGVRGYEFGEFGDTLSEGARRNLGAAVEFLQRAIPEDRLPVAWPPASAAPVPEERGGVP
jgi:hydrogenase maturation protease